jgi:hypothetical protein
MKAFIIAIGLLGLSVMVLALADSTATTLEARDMICYTKILDAYSQICLTNNLSSTFKQN